MAADFLQRWCRRNRHHLSVNQSLFEPGIRIIHDAPLITRFWSVIVSVANAFTSVEWLQKIGAQSQQVLTFGRSGKCLRDQERFRNVAAVYRAALGEISGYCLISRD